jgi:hypothetical protein
MTSERSDPWSMRNAGKMHRLNRTPVTQTEFRTGHAASESAYVINRASEESATKAPAISIQTDVNQFKLPLF